MNETKHHLELKKVYLKDASFESPHTPFVFLKKDIEDPSIDLQLNLNARPVSKENPFFEIALHLTLTVKTKGDDPETLYLCEVEQAGLFELSHPDPVALDVMKKVTCPTILFPFAREEVHALIGKGGFPQVLLNPFNFEALYREKKEQEAQSRIN